MSFIEINNVRKSFDGKTDVLKDISLDVKEGELLTLLGPSGCGKSTLLRSIAGFNPIDSGEIIIDGVDVTGLAPSKRNLGMVFQAYSLFPNMNVYDNVSYGLKIQKIDKKKADLDVREMIEKVGLAGKESYFPSELSGGQQQRVALARALVTKPKVLLLDEPLSAIDPKLRKSLQELIKNIQRDFNITTIFVTHDQEEAFVVSDRVAVMDAGRILQIDRPLSLYSNPADTFVASFIGNYNILKASDFKKLTGRDVATNIAIRPELIKMGEISDPAFQQIHGRVVDVIPKGNILGYNIDIGGLILKVDLVLDRENYYEEGSEVIVGIRESDFLTLD